MPYTDQEDRDKVLITITNGEKVIDHEAIENAGDLQFAMAVMFVY